jgi:hypothetical protein
MSMSVGSFSVSVASHPDLQYLNSAIKKYDEGDMPSCLILLHHVSQLSAKVASLYTDAAYNLWKTVETGQIDEARREQYVKLIMNGFTRLLESGNHDLMKPIDYIRLSHIYAAEGALESSLRILQLASARGHFENAIIVFCIWIILKQFKDRSDAADSQMNFITSALLQSHLAKEDVSMGGMKLEFIMMHCANHLRMKFLATTREKLRKPAYDTFRAILTELYIAATKCNPSNVKEMLNWFDDSTLWMNAGRALEDTPYAVLLGEECYWQAFLRKPLDAEPLDLIINSMRRYKREHFARSLLEKAIKFSPWHVQCRNSLCTLDLEEEVPYMLSWLRVFETQEVKLCKIQAWIRGVLMRLWWRTGRVDIILRKQQALKKLNRSGKAYLIQRDRRKLQLFRMWKDYIQVWKGVKERSAIKIQVFWRRVWAEYCFTWARYRVRRANCIYLVASQHHANTKSTRVFRAWQDAATASKLRRSANAIVQQLRADKAFQKFHKYVTLLIELKRIRSRIYNNASFLKWMKIFCGRQRKHAMMTIRFYVRNNYKMKGQPPKKKETKAQLEQRMAATEAEVLRSISLNPVSKTRRAWKAWRYLLQSRRAQRARVCVATMLPLLWRRVGARSVVKTKRVKIEAEVAGVNRLERWQLYKVYRFFRLLSVTLRLQRFIRCGLSRHRLRRLRQRMEKVDKRYDAKCWQLLGKFVKLWRRALYLVFREKLRARRKIQHCFHLVRCHRVLGASSTRKQFIGRLLYAFHRKFMKKKFRALKMNTIIQYQIETLIPFCAALSKFHLRHNMRKWRELLHDQHKLRKIISVCVLKPIDRAFWKNAHVSTAESSVVTQKPNWRNTLTRGAGSGLLRTSSGRPGIEEVFSQSDVLGPMPALPMFLDFEKVVAPSVRLHSYRVIPKLRIFRIWVASYRRKCRDRRGGSQALVATVVPFIMDEVWHRISCRVVLQCAVRRFLALRKFSWRLRLRRVADERFRSLHVANVKRLLLELRGNAVARRSSRLKLQCIFRGTLARRLASKRRLAATRCKIAHQKLQTSLNRKALTRFVMDRLVGLFVGRQCNRLHNQFSSPDTAAHNRNQDEGYRAGKSLTKSVSTSNFRAKRSTDWSPKLQQDDMMEAALAGWTDFTRRSEGAVFNLAGFDKSPSIHLAPLRNEVDSFGRDYEAVAFRSMAMSLPSIVTTSDRGAAAELSRSIGASDNERIQDTSSKRRAASLQESKRLRKLHAHRDQQAKFQTHVFNAKLFQLRRTGVFVVTDGDLSGFETQLQPEETRFLVGSCETLFVQNFSSGAAGGPAGLSILRLFRGSKVILCGGHIADEEGLWLLLVLADNCRNRISDELQSSLPLALSLHFNGVHITPRVLYWLLALASQEGLKGNKLRLKELFADSDTLGSLGLLILISAFQVTSI